MPVEMLREYIGKEITVSSYDDLGGSVVTLLEIEENWIKVEDKRSVRIINGDAIKSIKIAKSRK